MSTEPTFRMNEWHAPAPGDVERIIAATKGRGAAEDEVSCAWGPYERERGYVEVYSGWGAVTAQLLRRAGWALTLIRETYNGDTLDGVWMRFHVTAWRGLPAAFRLDPARQRVPMPEGVFGPKDRSGDESEEEP